MRSAPCIILLSMTRRSCQKILLAPVLASGLVCSAAAAAPPVIVSGFYGPAESAKTRSPTWLKAKTYAWLEGVAARDPSVEAHLHTTIDALLADKGWELTEGDADVYFKTEIERLTAVSIGVLRIHAIDDPSKQGWRSLITDMVTNKREKFGRLLDKTLKRALKSFPRVKP